MFDINNYNIYIAYTIFILSNLFLLINFRKNISTLADPFVLYIIWISSINSFLFIYIIKNGVSILACLFMFITFYHILLLKATLHTI